MGLESANQIWVRPPLSEQEKIRADKKGAGWPRMSPDSVLVAAMGSHWEPGCWAKTADMVAYTIGEGIRCGFTELMDRCFHPYDGLGTMRNEAILMAMNEGCEWLCYVDNDIQPDKDTLIKLLNWQLPIVAPYIVEAGTGTPLHGPPLPINTGVRMAKWCVLSMLLFRTAVFNSFPDPGHFWSDAIGADEAIHFQKLWNKGHQLFLDTGAQVIAGRRPLYPLTAKKLSRHQWEEQWEDERRARFSRPPDRRPINPEDHRVKEGVYLPFLSFQPPPKVAESPKIEGTSGA